MVGLNQFGAQEPGSEAEIAAFCHSTYDATFPMSAKARRERGVTPYTVSYLA